MNRKMFIVFFAVVLVGLTVSKVRAQQATVRVVPASYTVQSVGATFIVNITVENVEDLYGWALKLYYPNNSLNGTSVTEGSFLKTGGFATTFLTVSFTDNYNSTSGLVDILCIRSGNVPGVNGTGTLATINFKSIMTGGPETLHLANVGLSDSNATAIALTAIDGQITVIPEFLNVLILPLLITLGLVAVALRKKNK